jgi:t-SNARE complex subunit (syntaxin)
MNLSGIQLVLNLNKILSSNSSTPFNRFLMLIIVIGIIIIIVAYVASKGSKP